MHQLHLIMPMAGAGSRFSKDGYALPKPIIEIQGKPFFYWAARSIEKYVPLADMTFVILRQHCLEHHLDQLIIRYFPQAKVTILPQVTAGPVLTCLEGLRDIPDEGPVLFNDCDHLFCCSQVNKLLIQHVSLPFEGGILTFPADTPQFSYVCYDESGRIVGTVEKRVVSNHAICGAYLFKNAEIFKTIAQKYLKTCPYKESFISGMYNVMCQQGMTIQDFMLDFHVEFGTPEEYLLAKDSCYFKELQ